MFFLKLISPMAQSFGFMLRQKDDVLSLNNSNFDDYVDHIYPIELEIKDTTETESSASILDLHLKFDNKGKLMTKLYKRDG